MASLKNIQSVHESQVIVWDEEGVRVVGAGARLNEEALVIRIQKSYAHPGGVHTVSYTHLRAHETVLDLVCRLLLEKKKDHTLIVLLPCVRVCLI